MFYRLLWKYENNINKTQDGVNECEKVKTEREKVLKDLNKTHNTKFNKLLKTIEYHYYSKRYIENKN